MWVKFYDQLEMDDKNNFVLPKGGLISEDFLTFPIANKKCQITLEQKI